MIQHHVNAMRSDVRGKLAQEVQDVLDRGGVGKPSEADAVSDVGGRHKLLR